MDSMADMVRERAKTVQKTEMERMVLKHQDEYNSIIEKIYTAADIGKFQCEFPVRTNVSWNDYLKMKLKEQGFVVREGYGVIRAYWDE